MVLIQSQSKDLSTDGVLAWINYLYPGQSFIRINDEKRVGEINYTISDETNCIEFNIDGHSFSSQDIPARWYRQGSFSNNKVRFKYDTFNEFFISTLFHSYLKEEMVSLNDELDKAFSSSPNSINKFNDNQKGKLENVNKAKLAGLKIPSTLFTNSPQKLLGFIDKHGKVITKANHQNRLYIAVDKATILLRLDTKLVSKKEILNLLSEPSDSRYSIPSLFQEYIEKKFELRIFFLAGKFFCMAIFSQSNEKTKLDYRKYDLDRPNRCVPFDLPDHIKEKLTDFMRLMDMNCGSIDMIYTPKGEYIFLEVNPIGQFNWVDKSCNYFLEREIANFLYHERQQL